MYFVDKKILKTLFYFENKLCEKNIFKKTKTLIAFEIIIVV